MCTTGLTLAFYYSIMLRTLLLPLKVRRLILPGSANVVDLLIQIGYTIVIQLSKEHNIMTTVTLTLTAKQARLVEVAIKQEIIKGSSTFLSGRDVLDLGRILDQIHEQNATERAL